MSPAPGAAPDPRAVSVIPVPADAPGMFPDLLLRGCSRSRGCSRPRGGAPVPRGCSGSCRAPRRPRCATAATGSPRPPARPRCRSRPLRSPLNPAAGSSRGELVTAQGAHPGVLPEPRAFPVLPGPGSRHRPFPGKGFSCGPLSSAMEGKAGQTEKDRPGVTEGEAAPGGRQRAGKLPVPPPPARRCRAEASLLCGEI